PHSERCAYRSAKSAAPPKNSCFAPSGLNRLPFVPTAFAPSAGSGQAWAAFLRRFAAAAPTNLYSTAGLEIRFSRRALKRCATQNQLLHRNWHERCDLRRLGRKTERAV